MVSARSPFLRPEIGLTRTELTHTNLAQRYHLTPPRILHGGATALDIVQGIINRRRELLAQYMITIASHGLRPLAGRGRILVQDLERTWPDPPLFNMSGGFFDLENAPPWDTWIAWIDNLDLLPSAVRESCHYSALLSWIPQALVPSIDAVLELSPGATPMMWFEDLEGLLKKMEFEMRINEICDKPEANDKLAPVKDLSPPLVNRTSTSTRLVDSNNSDASVGRPAAKGPAQPIHTVQLLPDKLENRRAPEPDSPRIRRPPVKVEHSDLHETQPIRIRLTADETRSAENRGRPSVVGSGGDAPKIPAVAGAGAPAEHDDLDAALSPRIREMLEYRLPRVGPRS